MTAPDWAAVENAVASIAIIAGGLWAGWKWGYGEALRKRREYSDLDGTLTAASVPLPGDKAYLTLQAVWRNPGPGPVTVCPEHSFVEQYEFVADPPRGSLRIADYPGAAKIATVPLHLRGYVLGPQTETVMVEHFVVAAGSVYAFCVLDERISTVSVRPLERRLLPRQRAVPHACSSLRSVVSLPPWRG